MKKTVVALAVALAAVLALPSGALARDRDHDHMRDRWERHHHLKVGVNDARRDPDHDGLVNVGEFPDDRTENGINQEVPELQAPRAAD
jgi:hypothetical protein